MTQKGELVSGGKPPKLGRVTLPIGFDGFVLVNQVVVIREPVSSGAKKLKRQAQKDGKLIDTTLGRRTRAMIVTASNHLILSAVSCETLRERMEGLGKEGGREEKGEPIMKLCHHCGLKIVFVPLWQKECPYCGKKII